MAAVWGLFFFNGSKVARYAGLGGFGPPVDVVERGR